MANSLSGPSLYGPEQDEADKKWLEGFVGSSIPEGSLIKGFISVIAWIEPDGTDKFRLYSCLDTGLSESLGYLERAKFLLQYDAAVNEREEEDG